MTILNQQGQEVKTQKVIDDLPIMTCQAQRPKSIEESDVIITCHSQVFLMGVSYKVDEESKKLFPLQVEVCAVCGGINSKGLDKEANGFSEAIKDEGKKIIK